jgi:hypothetical protein
MMKLSPSDKVLIIPDLRTKHESVEDIIDIVKPKLTIFLGSYFDALEQDTPEKNVTTAKWLKSSLWKAGRIHLLSNTDLQYAFNHLTFFRQPSYSHDNASQISAVLSEMDWATCRFIYWEIYVMCTAGGLDPKSVPEAFRECKSGQPLYDFLMEAEHDAWEALLRGYRHWLYSDAEGGVTSNSRIKDPISNVIQVHGFNRVPSPARAYNKKGTSFNFGSIKPGDELPPHLCLITGNSAVTPLDTSRLAEYKILSPA